MQPRSSSHTTDSSGSSEHRDSMNSTKLTQYFQTAQTEVYSESVFSAQEHVDILDAVFDDSFQSPVSKPFFQRIFTHKTMITLVGTLVLAGMTSAGMWWHTQMMQHSSEQQAVQFSAQETDQTELALGQQAEQSSGSNNLQKPMQEEQKDEASLPQKTEQDIVWLSVKELRAIPAGDIVSVNVIKRNGADHVEMRLKDGRTVCATRDVLRMAQSPSAQSPSASIVEEPTPVTSSSIEPKIKITMNNNNEGQRRQSTGASVSVPMMEGEGMKILTADEFKKMTPEGVASVNILAQKNLIAVQMKDGTTLYAAIDAISDTPKKSRITKPVLAVKNASPDNIITADMANNLIKAVDKNFQLPKMVELSEQEIEQYGVQFEGKDLQVGLLNIIAHNVIALRIPYSTATAEDRGMSIKTLNTPAERQRMVNAQSIRMITNVQGETVLKNYMNIWKQRSDLYNAILALPNKPAKITEALIDTILLAKTLLDNENIGKTKKATMMINSTGARDEDFMKSAGAIIERGFDEYVQKSFNTSRLVPVLAKKDGGNATFIVWFEPTKEFLQALPERYRNAVATELALSEKYTTLCDIPTDKERKELAGRTYFDTWRSCSGALTMQSLSPNPVRSGIATVQFKSTEQRYVNIAVHDMTGNRVLEVLHAESVQGVRESVLDVSSLRSGMYMLVITSDRGEQVVQRMVVER